MAVNKLICAFILTYGVSCIDVLNSSQCKPGQYFEPGTLSCIPCPANSSMITSEDGLSCMCNARSIPLSPSLCRLCNATEIVSADGLSCVPRKCQTVGTNVACRKCPVGYISVTQQLDGSPMKEVQCVKCAAGFKPNGNTCTRCKACSCGKQHFAVSGECVPKRFVSERPKYEGAINSVAMLDVVKYEYLCLQFDVISCRRLANACVKYFYPADLGGPCRLWLQPKLVAHKNLPPLNIESSSDSKSPGEIILSRGDMKIKLVLIENTEDGGLQYQQENDHINNCGFPLQIDLGSEESFDCSVKLRKSDTTKLNSTFTPLILLKDELKPVPVVIRKPSGSNVERGAWSNTKFRRYYLLHEYLSASNTTEISYLRILLIKIRIQRQSDKSGELKIQINIEAHYSIKSVPVDTITSTLEVKQELPAAGLLKSLEIWSSVLGTLVALYAIAQWRGVVRRGGLQFSLLPLMSAAISDALYFGAWFSALHVLLAQKGTLGIALPLSHSEENMIKVFIYSAIALKAINVLWTNWNQCRCDVFFLDWSEYNPPYKREDVIDKPSTWRQASLARYWNKAQSNRRTSLWYTTTLALFIYTFLEPWKGSLPKSSCYAWTIGSIAWWSAYGIIITGHYVMERLLGSPTEELTGICRELGLSLLVFQEENYAHYVHGRDEDSPDSRAMSGPLKICRVVCSPQLRTIYRQLSVPVSGVSEETEARKVLLNKFLAAFFERALDGLGWVASERSVLERLLDVEITVREAGNTSVLLYDADDNKPSCFNVTWWGEEWSLATFDAMLYGAILISTDDKLFAAFITLFIWQITKSLRSWLGLRNNTTKNK